MPFMRRTKRTLARTARSKPTNVMFSNGLGICKHLGNRGMLSICLIRTRPRQ